MDWLLTDENIATSAVLLVLACSPVRGRRVFGASPIFISSLLQRSEN